ncbi:M48 family metalloprotease [Methanolobus sp. ZRKC3]|uniref:M48 family metalloprotease n=1 Tax=Methanolobus sp. ZRKC3 TaxID=3125786 RepID=UPI0032532772
MQDIFSIQEEVECYVACINDANVLPLLLFSLFMAVLMFSIYHRTKKPLTRISSFVGSQLFIIATIATVVYAMQCNQMLSIEIYLAYVLISGTILIFLPRIYYRILIRRYNAQPITEIMDWPQEFVNGIDREVNVYQYDSAILRAFASGKAIFLSLGMLELMDETELKAILAHEMWHIRHNAKTPILRQLSMVTFTKNRSEDELELLADEFASKLVDRKALESARAKLN